MKNTKFYSHTTTPDNQMPVASLALTAIEALIGSIIQLDGRKSRDPEGQPLSFSWSFVQVPVGSSLDSTHFRLLRENGAAVSFIPDKIGLYVVQLVVNDGELDSEPVTASINIQLSRVPIGEGIIPDLSFLWQHISNFWDLVQDKGYIESVWSAVTQLIGAEMVKLWSNDYNKSLKTIQENVQRRWQKFSFVTDLRGLEQRVIVGSPPNGNDDGNMGYSGKVDSTPGVGYTRVFYVAHGDASGETDFTRLKGNYGPKGRVIAVNGDGFTIDRVYNIEHEGLGKTVSVVVVNEEAIPDGLVGAVWRVPHLLHTPGLNLEEEGVKSGDVVVFEVKRRDIGLTAELRAQVIGVDRDRLGFEFTLDTLTVEGDTVSRSLIRDVVRDLKLIPGSSDADIAAAAEVFLSFIPIGINVSNRPFSPFRIVMKAKEILHNSTIKIPREVFSIPALQENVYEPPVVLRENLDYLVEDGEINFVSGLFLPSSPTPRSLWAEGIFVDNSQAIEDNFGRLVHLMKDDLTEKKTRAPYLSAVKGLFYAMTNGPSVANIRLGLQILFGLPFAEETGVILELDEDYATSSDGTELGRLLVEDIDEKGARLGLRRVYFYPTLVGLEENPRTGVTYKAGDIVERWAPISKGVEVEDYVKNPDWWRGALSGMEVMKYFTFKATIDGEVFDTNDVKFALEFVNRIKPAYTKVISAVLKELSDDIEIDEFPSINYKLKLYDDVGWGLESTPKAGDSNQQGAVLWNYGTRPFCTRTLRTLRDVVTSKDGADVLVESATGWGLGDLRGRINAGSIFTNSPVREGDLLVILRGQPGAGISNHGVYEIKEVVDTNTLKLLCVASSPDPVTFYFSALDADLFDYGSDLVCCILRREMNPVVMGDDLVTSSASNTVTSASATFLADTVGPDDHLVIETGANEGEYRIDTLGGSPLDPGDPLNISETQVKLVNLDGTSPAFTDLSSQDFRVVRPIVMSNVVEGVESVYTGSRIELVAEDPGLSGEYRDVFTPGLVGTTVNVSGSDEAANDGYFTVTEYVHPGRIAISSSSTTSDSIAMAIVRINSIWHPGFESMDELAPNEAVTLTLIGSP